MSDSPASLNSPLLVIRTRCAHSLSGLTGILFLDLGTSWVEHDIYIYRFGFWHHDVRVFFCVLFFGNETLGRQEYGGIGNQFIPFRDTPKRSGLSSISPIAESWPVRRRIQLSFPLFPNSYKYSLSNIGAADKLIKLWRNGQCVQTMKGHTDVVRSLALIPSVGFISSSNDGYFFAWTDSWACVVNEYSPNHFIHRLLGLYVSGISMEIVLESCVDIHRLYMD